MKAYTIYVGLTDRHGKDHTDENHMDLLRDNIVEILEDNGIEGATIYEGTGVWHREEEHCFVIYVSHVQEAYIEPLCQDLAEHFDQESVGYHESPALKLVDHPYL